MVFEEYFIKVIKAADISISLNYNQYTVMYWAYFNHNSTLQTGGVALNLVSYMPTCTTFCSEFEKKQTDKHVDRIMSFFNHFHIDVKECPFSDQRLIKTITWSSKHFDKLKVRPIHTYAVAPWTTGNAVCSLIIS